MALIFLFKNKIFSPYSFTTPTLTARLPAITTFILQDGKSFIFNMWNNPACQMNYWVCTTGTYRSTPILEKAHKAFFNYCQFHVMANMPDDIVLARMMTTLHLKLKRALHYHDDGYDSNNNYGLPNQIMRPVHIYSVFSAEASFNLADYTTAKSQLSPFTQDILEACSSEKGYVGI